ncbi:antiterminator LoaP [Paenibacillus sp. JNUCC31]|uniref:antiterminator LoaP n=1 Tax=Paenibacillus sp. JNUCC-31 TaxID=2777983 RepID=UPI00177CFF30|nr:antiterminator LoaP [Paenibacillus sp. JNUCC-31]QOS80436.1 antiterminator LoaP [Paenibacillus sp. JNUCC-31]
MKWYALSVQTGEENKAKLFLQNKFDQHVLQCLVPKRLVPERKNGEVYHAVKLIFPGYLFIRTHMTFKLYYEIKKTPRVLSLLSYLNPKDRCCDWSKKSISNMGDSVDEDTFFKNVPDDEMSQILKLLDDKGMLSYSQVVVQESEVFVQSGPLTGMESMIKKIDKRKKRAKVSIHFLDSDKVIDVGIDVISSPSITEQSQNNRLGGTSIGGFENSGN